MPTTTKKTSRTLEPYYHDDGTLVEFQQGSHGIDPQFTSEEELWLYYDVETCGEVEDHVWQERRELLYEFKHQYASKRRTGSPQFTRRHMASDDGNTAGLPLIIEFINWGKIHYYPFTEYENIAPRWRENLVNEGTILYRSLKFDEELFEEFTSDSWFFRRVSQLLANAKVPKLDYKELWDRCNNTVRAVENENYSYEDLHEAGVEFCRLRYIQRRYGKVFTDYRNGVIKGSERGVEGLKLVESGAFGALDLFAQGYALGNPVAEAAYRMAVVLARVGSRSAGEALAGSNGEKILNQARVELRQDVPPILTDLILAPVSGYMKAVKGLGKAQRLSAVDEAAVALLKGIVDLVFQVIDRVAFKKETLDETWLKQLGIRLLENALVGIVKALLHVPNGQDERAKKYADACITAVVIVVSKDWRDAMKKAEEQDKDTWTVFFGDIGWTLARIAQTMLLNVGQDQIKKAGEGHRVAAEMHRAIRKDHVPPGAPADGGVNTRLVKPTKVELPGDFFKRDANAKRPEARTVRRNGVGKRKNKVVPRKRQPRVKPQSAGPLDRSPTRTAEQRRSRN